MSPEMWAGYISGVIGLLIGNPLDIRKMRHQTQDAAPVSHRLTNPSNLVKGTAAPIMGYGAMNALLFASYHRSQVAYKAWLSSHDGLVIPWLAGATAGLAIWIVSTPTELIKCRAQLSKPTLSSLEIARQIFRTGGLKGLYRGGLVTALRDSIGYGFYFSSYELAMQFWAPCHNLDGNARLDAFHQDAPRVLLCGGFAGVATWVSIFPLDVIKSRLQAQAPARVPDEGLRLLASGRSFDVQPNGAWQIAKNIYWQGGLRPFFRGITICSVRAFIVNAVQWMVYESILQSWHSDTLHSS